jgi:hypothetical protein
MSIPNSAFELKIADFVFSFERARLLILFSFERTSIMNYKNIELS